MNFGAAQTVHDGDPDFHGGTVEPWVPDGPNSDWIAISAATSNNGPAPYSFTTTFNLTGLNPTTVTTSGLKWSVDDGGILFLNGKQIAAINPVTIDTNTAHWTTPGSFTLPLAYLNAGVNTITMTITNADQTTDGARLEGTITAGPASTGHFVGYNENFQNLTGSTQNQVNIVLQGDWTGLIQVNYPTFGVGNTGFTTSFANGQTTLTIFSNNGVGLPSGATNPPPHVGYSLFNGQGGGEGASPETVLKYFGPLAAIPAAPLRLAAPTFFVNNPGSGANTRFLILYATVELGNGSVSGEWDEQQVPAGANVRAMLGNFDESRWTDHAYQSRLFSLRHDDSAGRSEFQRRVPQRARRARHLAVSPACPMARSSIPATRHPPRTSSSPRSPSCPSPRRSLLSELRQSPRWAEDGAAWGT